MPKEPIDLTVALYSEPQQYSIGDYVERIAKILGMVAIPIVIALSGYYIERGAKDSSIGRQYVELSINILRDEELLVSNPGLRVWARKIFEKYSPEPIPNDMTLVGYRLLVLNSKVVVGNYTYELLIDPNSSSFVISTKYFEKIINSVKIQMKGGTSGVALPDGSFLFSSPDGTFYHVTKGGAGNWQFLQKDYNFIREILAKYGESLPLAN